jgi:heme-binding NEAT domain protein
MRWARLEIAIRDYGVRTWGAYQHYGNPRLRFFSATLNQSPDAEPAEDQKAEPNGQSTKSAPKPGKRKARPNVSSNGSGKRARRHATAGGKKKA